MRLMRKFQICNPPFYPHFCAFMKNLEKFKAQLSASQSVVIITHFKPDADALGSSLGLMGFLKKKGLDPKVITPSDYPSFLNWMPGNNQVLALSKDSHEPEKQALELIATADFIFCLDFSSLKRINVLEEMVRTSNAKKVLIDHHLEPEHFADFEQWDGEAASTAGLIFDLIEELGEKELIDADIANCLYAGVMTDTGGFRHSNTTQKEFMIAADLVSRGASPSLVSKNIYDNNSIERLRLTGFVLSEKLEIFPEYRTALIMISWDELQKHGVRTGDTEGFVNYGLSVEGIVLSVLMYDRKEEIKMSFRSIGDFSVNEMAKKYFFGGGHKNASGGTSDTSLKETRKRFLEILPLYKEKLIKI